MNKIILNYNNIIKQLKAQSHECLAYADDSVLFSYSPQLDLAIESLNNTLKLLQNLLSSSFFL